MEGLEPLPSWAAWRLHGAHDGFEVAQFDRAADGVVISGASTGVEGDAPWWFRYRIELAPDWRTRRCDVDTVERRISIVRAADGWIVDGRRRPELDDCVDVDLEGSLVTNTLPVHRLDLPVGEAQPTPACYLRTSGEVERLDQSYRRTTAAPAPSVEYESTAFGYRDVLRFGRDGLVVDSPGLGSRIR